MHARLSSLFLFLLPSIALAQDTNSIPIADAGDPQTTYVGDAVALTGSATDPDGDVIVGWQWLVVHAPEGLAPILADDTRYEAVFLPREPGQYVISLTVFDGIDYSLPAEVTVDAVLNLPPVAIASADPMGGEAPLTVQFTGDQSYDPEGQPLTYNWRFGDLSQSSEEPNPAHTYAFPGNYRAVLTVTDDRMQQSTFPMTIAVTFATNEPPTVAMSADVVSGQAPLTVNFQANAFDPDGDALSFSWDFGDSASSDNTSTLENPSHTYYTEGQYVAWLTVSDGVEEITQSLTLVVESSSSVTTTRAMVIDNGDLARVFGKHGSVSWGANLDMPELTADDTISLHFDGVELFAAPLSEFRVAGRNLMMLKRGLFVKLEPDGSAISVIAETTDIDQMNLSNGATLQLYWGDSVGTDQFEMSEKNDHVWHYR